MSQLLVAQRALTVPGWAKDALWRSARAVPSVDLRFADNKSLVDAVTGASLVTFARAYSGTYVDSAGVLQTAATDVPRFDHNPTTGESLGLLVEEQRTNLLLNSGTLSTQSVTVTAVAHTLHFTGTGTITLTGTSTAGPLVGTGTGETNRVSLTFTPTAGSLTLTVSGTVTNAQLEAGAFRTSYIATAGAQATRSADVASITGTAFSGWYNQTEGTLFCNARTQQSAAGHILAGVSTGSFASSAYLSKESDNLLKAAPDAAPSNLNISLQSVSSNVGLRAALAFTAGTGSASAVMNGGTVGTDASTGIPITMSQMGIGTAPWNIGTTLWNGHIARLAYWPQALPSRLQALTQ